jgi:hypothetical protein
MHFPQVRLTPNKQLQKNLQYSNNSKQTPRQISNLQTSSFCVPQPNLDSIGKDKSPQCSNPSSTPNQPIFNPKASINSLSSGKNLYLSKNTINVQKPGKSTPTSNVIDIKG